MRALTMLPGSADSLEIEDVPDPEPAAQVAPAFLDWYLARTGVSGQQTDADTRPDDPHNLWRPADGEGGRDFGAEGRFTEGSWTRDPQIWASRHHGTVAALGAGALAGVAALVGRRR